MTARVDIKPDILTRAIERAGFVLEEFLLKNEKVKKWLEQEKQPTVKQLQDFSKKVHIPFGYLLLDELPEEELPIPFFRGGKQMTTQVSLAIYDTVLLLKKRQEWLSEYLKENDEDPLPFVGKFNPDSNPNDIVEDIRATLSISANWASTSKTWTEALSFLTQKIEETGVVVTFNGVVGNNTSRPLDPSECRGFVLIDEFVPFLFINNKDAKAAQMFTLAHELVHIWLGVSAGFDIQNVLPADDPVEILCDQVAAELLVPARLLREIWKEEQDLYKIARKFKVSPIVVGRRALDLGKISRPQFFRFYHKHMEGFRERNAKQKEVAGGNFYATTQKRISPRFFGYVNSALRQGHISHLEAYRLTGMKGKTFQAYIDKIT